MYYDFKSVLGKNESRLDKSHHHEYLSFTVLSLRARVRQAAVFSERLKTLTVFNLFLLHMVNTVM